MASAAISIISRLCSAGCQKKPNPNSANPPSSESSSSHPPPPPPPPAADAATTMIPPFPLEAASSSTDSDQNHPGGKELPLPPARQVTMQHGFSYRESSRNLLSKSSSTRGFLTKNFSIKLPRSLSMARNREEEEAAAAEKRVADQKKKKERLKHQDSVWTKTIILGEKCRVPDDEDEQDAVYDFKGNKISPYHPKASSRVVSRQNSAIDQNSIPVNDRPLIS